MKEIKMKINKKKPRLMLLVQLCLLMLASMMLAGCGAGRLSNSGKGGREVSQEDVETSIEKIYSDISAVDSSFPEMVVHTSKDDQAELNFSAASDADYSKVSGYYHAYSKEGLAYELLIVRVKDVNDLAEVMDTIKKHAESRIGTMEAYSPDQVALAKSYYMTHQGSYIGFFISDKAELDGNTFLESAGENGI